MTDREAMQQAQLEKLDGTLWMLNQELTRKQVEIDALQKLMQQALEALGLVVWTNNPPVNAAIAALRERLAQPDPGCAECGKSGGWALYCVECMEKLIAVAEREPLLDALTAICVKCRSNEWGPTTPRKEILNWMHDHASVAIAKLKEKNAVCK